MAMNECVFVHQNCKCVFEKILVMLAMQATIVYNVGLDEKMNQEKFQTCQIDRPSN